MNLSVLKSLTLTLLALIAMNDPASAQQVRILHTQPGTSLRSVAVCGRSIMLVGGSGGVLLRSTDGGTSWNQIEVSADAKELDYRDLEVLQNGNLVLMSAGPGERSRLFLSRDNGATWKEVYRNRLEQGFFNGMAFWPNGTGLLIGDPIDGQLFLLKATVSGEMWRRIPGPKMADGEYGFAASGTGIVATGACVATVATGAAAARVLMTDDSGETWKSVNSRVRHGNQSSGIFSVAVHPSGAAIAVGGDYMSPEADTNTYAWREGADTEWRVGSSKLPHKACVRFLDRRRVLCSGRTGIAFSADSGRTWKQISNESFYTFVVDPKFDRILLAGANGRIGILKLSNLPAAANAASPDRTGK